MKRILVKSRFFKTSMAVPVLCLAIACEDVTGYKDSPVDGYVSPKNFSVSGCKSTTRGLFEDETIEYKARENGLLRIRENLCGINRKRANVHHRRNRRGIEC